MLDRVRCTNSVGSTRAISPTQAVRAELIGDDTCCAKGLTVRAHTPVLAMCRRLIEANYDPATPLHCYRGTTLCLIVTSIGDAAELRINGQGTGFKKRPQRVPTAPPLAPLAAGEP